MAKWVSRFYDTALNELRQEEGNGPGQVGAHQIVDLTTSPGPSVGQVHSGGYHNHSTMSQGPPPMPPIQTTPMYVLAPTFCNGQITGHVAGTFVPLPGGQPIPSNSGMPFFQPVE